MLPSTFPPASGSFGTLSDEVILMILRHLTSPDLWSILQTCRRLHLLCQEGSLWKALEDPPDNSSSIRLAVNRLVNLKTTRVSLSAPSSPSNLGTTSSLPPSLLHKLLRSTPALRSLSLINQKLSGDEFNLKALPPTLTSLSLRGTLLTNVKEDSSYFRSIETMLGNLEELDLSFCGSFVTGHSLMPISKLEKLERLWLRGIRDIGGCFAYVALASRFGFKELRVLDLTDTKIGSMEFRALADVPKLEEYYVGQYDAFVERLDVCITDFCLTDLRSKITLKVLDISGSQVTDRSLAIFESIPSLSRVEAHFTQLTSSGVQDFHEIHPKCRIAMVPDPVLVPLRLPLDEPEEQSSLSESEDD